MLFVSYNIWCIYNFEFCKMVIKKKKKLGPSYEMSIHYVYPRCLSKTMTDLLQHSGFCTAKKTDLTEHFLTWNLVQRSTNRLQCALPNASFSTIHSDETKLITLNMPLSPNVCQIRKQFYNVTLCKYWTLQSLGKIPVIISSTGTLWPIY